MKSRTLGTRVALGFAAVIAVTLALGTVSFNRFLAVSAAGNFLAHDPVPGTLAIVDIAGAFKENLSLVAIHLTSRDKEACSAAIKQNKERIDQLLLDYEAIITKDEDRLMFAAFKEARATFVTEFVATLALSTAGKMDEAIAAMDTRLLPTYRTLDEALAKLVGYNKHKLHDGVTRIERASTSGKNTIMAGLAAAILTAVLIAYFMVRSTTRILARVADALDSGSSQIASAATQVSASSQSLAEGASEQAASLEETSASLEEMASMTKGNAENAQQAKSAAGDARSAADGGAGQMQAMQAAMDAILTASNEISKILKTIDEIAFQTNILALNAAVEAARAGDAGAGFAVVADEVRALAQRCAAAAKETAGKIEDSTVKSRQGAELSGEVAKSFGVIQQLIHRVDTLVGEIATATHEQNQGIGQITLAVSQMDKVTQSNAAAAEESAAAAEELQAQSSVMRESVGDLLNLIGGTSHPAELATPSSQLRPAASKSKGPAPTPAERLTPARRIHANGTGRTVNGRPGVVESELSSKSRSSTPTEPAEAALSDEVMLVDRR